MHLAQPIAQPTINRLPSLAENSWLRYFNFIALYFAQGVPEGMLTFGIPAWLAANGKSPGEIAAFAIVAVMPWSFKFILAPLMDRYSYLPMGRKRPWILIGQTGLVVSCIYMAYIPDPLNNLTHLMIGAFMVSFFGAFQDVATDGMAIDVIPAEQQAKANGFMWGSKICGISISLAAGSWLLNEYGFTEAILAMASAVAIIMLAPILLRERQGEKIAPWTKGNPSEQSAKLQITHWSVLFKSLYKAFSLKNSLLLVLVLFASQGGFKYISTLMPIFTVKELGWSNIEYSQNYATAKLIGGLAGMMLGGILIDRFGKKRMMSIYFIAVILLITVLSFSKIYWPDRSFIYAFMLVQNLLYTFACIGIFAIAMQCCWKKVSASQFTLYMTIANLGQMSFSALIGPLKANLNWQLTLFAAAVFIAISLLALQFLNVDKQVKSVEALNKEGL